MRRNVTQAWRMPPREASLGGAARAREDEQTSDFDAYRRVGTGMRLDHGSELTQEQVSRWNLKIGLPLFDQDASNRRSEGLEPSRCNPH